VELKVDSEYFWKYTTDRFKQIDLCVKSIFRHVCQAVLNDEKDEVQFCKPDFQLHPLPTSTKIKVMRNQIAYHSEHPPARMFSL